jgi:LysM repeat protein
MKNDPELKIDDNWSDENPYPPKRRRVESGSSKSLRILMVILLVLILGGGLLYFLGKGSTGNDLGPLQSKLFTLEQRMTGLEKQIVELQGKIGAPGPDTALLQRVDALGQKVEALEKQRQVTVGSKATPPASKSVASTEKRYHTVRKGETLYGISKKYGISKEELRKLNNLSANQTLRAGQKLLVSAGR